MGSLSISLSALHSDALSHPQVPPLVLGAQARRHAHRTRGCHRAPHLRRALARVIRYNRVRKRTRWMSVSSTVASVAAITAEEGAGVTAAGGSAVAGAGATTVATTGASNTWR